MDVHQFRRLLQFVLQDGNAEFAFAVLAILPRQNAANVLVVTASSGRCAFGAVTDADRARGTQQTAQALVVDRFSDDIDGAIEPSSNKRQRLSLFPTGA